MDAIILAGGKGTRLASIVSDVPKPLAPVNGRPFLDYIIGQLLKSNTVTRVILSIGHLADKIVDYYANADFGMPIIFAKEETLLGTGGAIKFAADQYIKGESFLVMNGDSMIDANFDQFAKYHACSGNLVSILLAQVQDSARYGSVELKGSRIVKFTEKTGAAVPGVINAGVYLIEKSFLSQFPVGKCSFETDVLPKASETGRVGGHISDGAFLDMGLPESYAEASLFLKRIGAR